MENRCDSGFQSVTTFAEFRKTKDRLPKSQPNGIGSGTRYKYVPRVLSDSLYRQPLDLKPLESVLVEDTKREPLIRKSWNILSKQTKGESPTQSESQNQDSGTSIKDKLETLFSGTMHRNQHQRERIEAFMRLNNKTFQQLPLTQRLHLSWIAHYQCCSPGMLVYEEGTPLTRVLFVVSGTLSASTNQGGVLSELSILGPGTCFGRLEDLDEVKFVTITSKEECHIVVVDKQSYLELEQDRHYIETQLNDLKRYEPFRHVENDSILEYVQVEEYEPDHTLLRDNDTHDRIAIILEGYCKTVASMQQRRSDWVLNTFKETPIQQLGPGCHFPGIPPGILDSNSERMRHLFDGPVGYMVVSTSRIKVAWVKTPKLLSILPDATVHEMVFVNNLYKPSQKDLQAWMNKKQKWEGYRKTIVKSMKK